MRARLIFAGQVTLVATCALMVGNNCIARYDQQSDDYAHTHARKAAEKWNAEA